MVKIIKIFPLILVVFTHFYQNAQGNVTAETQLKTPLKNETTPLKAYMFTNLTYPYKLPSLPYEYAALEPHIDKETMHIHHTKHHQAYIDNLNKALEQFAEYQSYNLEDLLINLEKLPTGLRNAVQANGGGHYNHVLFWEVLSPHFDQSPSPLLLKELVRSFGSYEKFKELFNQAAQACFGSGWVWLALDAHNNIVILSTSNQNNPLSQGLRPILGLDVWEHAYYLKYQNRRMDYVNAWWHVLNWKKIEENYHKARAI